MKKEKKKRNKPFPFKITLYIIGIIFAVKKHIIPLMYCFLTQIVKFFLDGKKTFKEKLKLFLSRLWQIISSAVIWLFTDDRYKKLLKK